VVAHSPVQEQLSVRPTRSQAPTQPCLEAPNSAPPSFLLRLDITVTGDNNFYMGLSEHISGAGVFIATHNVLPIGTSVKMCFTLPCTDDTIVLVGTVHWVRGPRAISGGDVAGQPSDVKVGMGVRFSSMDPLALGAIRKFMRLRDPDFFE
jgi:Tfp pilus assembly protein PilZ